MWSHLWLCSMLMFMSLMFYATHTNVHTINEVIGQSVYILALIVGFVVSTLFYEITQRRWSSWWIVALLYVSLESLFVSDDTYLYVDIAFLCMYGFAFVQSFSSWFCMWLFMAMNVTMGFMEDTDIDSFKLYYFGFFVIMYFYLHFSSCI
jgi:hypothetical protein